MKRIVLKKTKITLIWLSITILPILLFGILHINDTKKELIQSAEDQLSLILNEKEAELEKFFEETKNVALDIQNAESVKEYIKLINNPKLKNSSSGYEDHVRNLIFAAQESDKYNHIFLSNRDGRVILSPNERDKTKDTLHHNFYLFDLGIFREALIRPVISDFSTWIESDNYYLLMLHPIKDWEGKTNAVLTFELDITYLNTLLLEEGFTIALIDENMNSAVKLKNSKRHKVMKSNFDETKNKGHFFGKFEINGILFFGYYKKMENYPLILIAEISESDVFNDLENFKASLLIILWLTFVIVLVSNSIYFYQNNHNEEHDEEEHNDENLS